MIGDIFFARLGVFQPGRRCFIGNNGWINIALTSELKDVFSTKLRTITQQFQKCLNSLDDSFKDKRSFQLVTLCVNLTDFNLKIEKWNHRVTASCFLRLINWIFTIKITPLNLTQLGEMADKKSGEEKAAQEKILDSKGIKEFMDQHCESISGDFSTAKYIFFGDTHSDSSLDLVRTIILNHIRKFYPKKSCKILEEGVPFGSRARTSYQFYIDPRLIHSSEVRLGGWDNVELHNKQLACLKGIESLSTSSADVEKRKQLWIDYKRFKVLRDQAMIESARKVGKTAERVICVAGSNHLVDKETGYKVSDSFPGECVVIIPKSVASEDDNDKCFSNLLSS